MTYVKYGGTFLEVLVRGEWMRSRKEGSHMVLKRSLERVTTLGADPSPCRKAIEEFIQEYEALGEQPHLFAFTNGCLCSYPRLFEPRELIAAALAHYREVFSGAVPAKVDLTIGYLPAMQAAETYLSPQGEVVQLSYILRYPPQMVMCWSSIEQKHQRKAD